MLSSWGLVIPIWKSNEMIQHVERVSVLDIIVQTQDQNGWPDTGRAGNGEQELKLITDYKDFLTEDANTHLEHLEDDLIDHGVQGGENAIRFLESLRDMVAGNTSKSISVTVKWDGAPAVWAGTNPENGKFFVGTKSIFNKPGGRKGPLINYTHADIDKNHPGGPGPKLHVALDHFRNLRIPDIWQGDILFTKEDLTAKTIDGQNMITFTPNTITYAVPEDSKLAKDMLRAKIGIVWHTTYSGETMTDMSPNYGADSSQLRKSNAVWSTDATFQDESGTVTMTTSETDKFNRMLNMANGSLKKASSYLRVMERQNPKDDPWVLSSSLKVFFNSQIRSGAGISDTKRLVSDFEKFYVDKLMKKINSVKSDSGKKQYEGILKDGQKEFNKYKRVLYFVFASYITLRVAKEYIVRKLEKIKSSVASFIKTSDGYKVTAPEGFVAIDRVGKALKLVDRMEFSRANFTVAKNWA